MFSFDPSPELIDLLYDLAFAVIILAQILVFISWHKFDRIQRVIGTIISLSLLNVSSERILYNLEINNYPVYHVYTPVLFVLMTLVYRQILNQLISAKYLNRMMVAFVIFSVINALFLQDLKSLNSNTINLSGLLYIVFAVLAFYSLLKSSTVEYIHKSPFVWFNIGVLTYYSGTLILFFAFRSLFAEDPKLVMAGMVLNIIFNIVLIITYIASICLRSQE